MIRLASSFIGLKKLQQLQYDENFELYDNYVVTKDHKHLLIFITPAYPPNNTGKNALLLKGIDSIIEQSAATITAILQRLISEPRLFLLVMHCS